MSDRLEDRGHPQGGRGLQSVELQGDVLVAYAAKAGTVALDGVGKHSPLPKR